MTDKPLDGGESSGTITPPPLSTTPLRQSVDVGHDSSLLDQSSAVDPLTQFDQHQAAASILPPYSTLYPYGGGSTYTEQLSQQPQQQMNYPSTASASIDGSGHGYYSSGTGTTNGSISSSSSAFHHHHHQQHHQSNYPASVRAW